MTEQGCGSGQQTLKGGLFAAGPATSRSMFQLLLFLLLCSTAVRCTVAPTLPRCAAQYDPVCIACVESNLHGKAGAYHITCAFVWG
jgi:hypothetical protein